jgi:serine/threonine protein kinase
MGTDADTGERLLAGRYRLVRLLGRGGMGRVWRANDDLLQRPVAVKEVLFPAGITEEETTALRERTLREAVSAARLNSVATIRVFDVVEADRTPWIVMELVEGPSLSEVLKERGALSPQETAQVGLGLVDALAEAHRAGIVHRDVKPGNVLFRPDGRVVLTDFGIARFIEDPTMTTTGLLLGSPSYIAPERAQGATPCPESDLWSLGATLYTAVEGRPPYDRGEPFATLAAVVNEPPAPMERAGPLAPLLSRLLARDPGARPEADEVRRELARAAESLPTPTTAEPTLALPTETLERADRTVAVPAAAREPAPAPAARDAAPPPPAPEGVLPPAPVASPPQRRRPPPPPRRRARRRRPPVAPFAALLAVVLTGLVGWALLRSGGSATDSPGGGGRKSPATHSPTAPRDTEPATQAPAAQRSAASPAPTTRSPSARPGGGALPAGWTRYTNPDIGWSVGVPAGWQRRISGGHSDFLDPAGGRYVRIDTRTPPGPSAKGAWEDYEPGFAKTHSGYRRIRIENVAWRDYTNVADWEFTYTSRGTTLHALDRGAVIGGHGYGIFFQTRESRWQDSQPLLADIFRTFRPAR